ncbi:MAG: tetratricopeptide repeat protein [Alphaproteobacteria bacterium]
MALVRLAALAAVTVALGACAPTQPPQGGLPQSVTLRNTDTGTTRQVSGASVVLVVAQREMARRNFGGAVNLVGTAIRSGQLAGSELSAAHALRGDAYYLAGDAARARDDWRTAVEIDGRNTTGLRGMAIVAHLQRKIPESMQFMQRAIDISPDNPHLYITRGLFRLEDRRQIALAHADFDKAVTLKPDLAAAYFYRGLASHMSGRYAVAKGDYEKALEINPGEGRARQALGLLERRQAPDDSLAPRGRRNEVVQF